MNKLKIYLETSTISHLDAPDAPDKMADTKLFWQDLLDGKYELFISPVVIDEIEKTRGPKLDFMLEQLNGLDFTLLAPTEEVYDLADEYLRQGLLPPKSVNDRLHIAFAVVYNCDAIVSWNFNHLVNFTTNKRVRIINAINHYKEISLISPTMMIKEGSE